uniref:Serine/threonine kinase-like domain-containing protein STKLD1 n=1 Tax=Lepisosteus oculatus TaxID=7918 RepID=W5M759_LEPOC|nr:PREDICTED: serine/threonine kinase-like domain-containing protein STKLD1 isoform X1 [Lepisosteus oculatus]
MEKYVILNVMEPGSYGAVQFVRDRRSEQDFTLKRVECLDEERANQALKEALWLLELQHSNVIRYKELFITWDRKISSVMLCLVMECSYLRSLSSAIRIQREKGEVFKEKVIRRMLGHTVDALAYLHKQNIIHRNLKPSNILMTKDLTFMLFDFGIPTVTGDELKLEKRIKENGKSWMAPETLAQRLWSEKSDVWSLGCILLEMLSCHLLDAEESLSLLRQTRQDSSPIDIITFPDLSYSLRRMLERNPETRATVWELTRTPFVKECLVQCGSPLSGLKKKLPPGLTGALSEEGIEKVLEFMQNFSDVEEGQLSGLEYLSVQRDMSSRIPQALQTVLSAMGNHLDSVEVQNRGCRVLFQLLITGLEHSLEEPCLYTEEVTSSVIQAIRAHSTNEELLSAAFQIVLILSRNETSTEKIGGTGGIQDIVRALKMFPENRDVCLSCCGALWGLLVNKHTSGNVSTAGALEAVITVGETHLDDWELMESVCAALWSLTLRGSLREKECEDTALTLMHALRTHTKRQGVIKYASLALASLVSSSELAAFRVLLAPSGGSGVQLLKEICLYHHDDPEVMENICSLLNEMVQYDDVIPEFVSENVKEELQKIQIKFASNKEILLLAQSALSKMHN